LISSLTVGHITVTTYLLQAIVRHESAQSSSATAAEVEQALAALQARVKEQAKTIQRLESHVESLQAAGASENLVCSGDVLAEQQTWNTARERAETKLCKRQVQLEGAIMQVLLLTAFACRGPCASHDNFHCT
jgi:uncharacterized protein YciI